MPLHAYLSVSLARRSVTFCLLLHWRNMQSHYEQVHLSSFGYSYWLLLILRYGRPIGVSNGVLNIWCAVDGGGQNIGIGIRKLNRKQVPRTSVESRYACGR